MSTQNDTLAFFLVHSAGANVASWPVTSLAVVSNSVAIGWKADIAQTSLIGRK
jgi:hypothetical protein